MRRTKIEGAHSCPVCGKTTFSAYNSFEICAVCGWEDETWCEEYPDEESTANYLSLNEYRRRYLQRVSENPEYTWAEEKGSKESPTAFESWRGFILQLVHFECPTEGERERIDAELAVIERTDCAKSFQAVHTAWQSLYVNGFRGYVTGDAEKWYLFYFLGMTEKNPIDGEVPASPLCAVSFVMRV